MPSDKPLFESRDLGSTPAPSESLFDAKQPGTDAEKDGKKKYLGPERRKDNRRSQTDLSLIHISEPTRPPVASRMPSSA